MIIDIGLIQTASSTITTPTIEWTARVVQTLTTNRSIDLHEYKPHADSQRQYKAI
jgi:hypothetical protein